MTNRRSRRRYRAPAFLRAHVADAGVVVGIWSQTAPASRAAAPRTIVVWVDSVIRNPTRTERAVGSRGRLWTGLALRRSRRHRPRGPARAAALGVVRLRFVFCGRLLNGRIC